MSDALPPPPADRPPGWSDRYAPPEPGADVVAYLRANSGRYTREALDAAAGGGRPRARGDRGRVGGGPVRGQRRGPQGSARPDRRDHRAGLRRDLAAGDRARDHPDRRRPYAPVVLLAGILAVALFIPGIIAVAIARSAGWLRRAGVGRVVAFAFVPMLILFALAGTCVSATQGMS